jgi:hypothetical protein
MKRLKAGMVNGNRDAFIGGVDRMAMRFAIALDCDFPTVDDGVKGIASTGTGYKAPKPEWFGRRSLKFENYRKRKEVFR